MTLEKPTSEDIQKIHREVNQIVNQRFIVSTLAVTVFVLATAWQINIVTSSSESKGKLVLFVAFLQFSLLFLLYIFQHYLKKTMRVFTTYLLTTKSSNWEVHWENFRNKVRKAGGYSAYSKPIAFLYLILVFLALGTPLLMKWFQFIEISNHELRVLVIVGIITEVLILVMGYGNWMDPEKKLKNDWLITLGQNK